MGRMLETLAQAEARQNGRGAAPLVSPEGEEEVPFIEVGPSHTLEASPAVLAACSIKKPQGGNGSGSPLLPPVARAPGASAPLSVSFRPMPRDCGQDPPARRFAAELIAWHQPDHPASEQYRQLAAALRQNAGGQSHILLCTSLKADIRATAVVLNLAISLARQEELSVVVVDGRTVEPALDSQLGLRSQTGLAEVLAGIESLETALQETGVTNLAALTAGREDPARRLRALDETCRPVLRQLRDRFNMVLIDGAPCQMSGEARGLETACDAVYVVLPAREAETPDTAECLRALHVQGIPIRGCILLG